jgi:hypothetical protein
VTVEEVFVRMLDPDRALIVSHSDLLVGATGGFVVRLEPGDSFHDIPYEAWDARRGEIVSVAEFAAEYAEHGVRAPTPDPPTSVKCPRCGWEMLLGTVDVVSGSASFGHPTGRSELRYTPTAEAVEEGAEAFVVVKGGLGAKAFQCPECRSVYIP